LDFMSSFDRRSQTENPTANSMTPVRVDQSVTLRPLSTCSCPA
jgi:hypothetical protein